MYRSVLTIAAVLSTFLVSVTYAENQLKFVLAIWRHGDRAPNRLPYPLDENDESMWPNGWNQLTDMGVKQLGELGIFIQKRYRFSLLKSMPDPDIQGPPVSVLSSLSQRAINSAEAFLKSFCKMNKVTKIRNKKKSKRTIINEDDCPPVLLSSSNEKNDPLLQPTSYNCPAYTEKEKQLNDPIKNDLTNEYDELIQFLSDVTGYGSDISLRKVARLNDLNREIVHNFKQPDWVFNVWPQYKNKTTLELVTDIKRILRIIEFNKPILSHLRGGFLLAEWMRHVARVINGTQKNPSKMMLYSSHDGTLQALRYALGIADDKQVPYAATLILEVYQRTNGTFFVQFVYRRNGKHELKKLRECDMECDANEFLSLFEDVSIKSIEDLEQQCNSESLTKLSN